MHLFCQRGQGGIVDACRHGRHYPHERSPQDDGDFAALGQHAVWDVIFGLWDVLFGVFGVILRLDLRGLGSRSGIVSLVVFSHDAPKREIQPRDATALISKNDKVCLFSLRQLDILESSWMLKRWKHHPNACVKCIHVEPGSGPAPAWWGLSSAVHPGSGFIHKSHNTYKQSDSCHS